MSLTLVYNDFKVGSYNIFIRPSCSGIDQRHFVLKITKVTDKFVTYILRDITAGWGWNWTDCSKECRRKVKRFGDDSEIKYPPSWGSDYSHWRINTSQCYLIEI